MKPLVTIIIPLYNCEKYIEKCLDSICQQIYSDIEIIIVDDGSTDAGADIVKRKKQQDSRIQYIYQENKGVAAARTKAIEQASGKYLLFVDADDYLSRDYVQDLTERAEADHSDMVVAGYTVVYSDSDRKQRTYSAKQYVRGTGEEWVYRISSTWSHLYLKKFWDDNGLQFIQEEGARAEDVPIVLFANARAERIAVVGNAGYYYVQHAGSAMNSGKKVTFTFPYNSFMMMYNKVNNGEFVNSYDFWYIGVIKFLAQFEYVIYRKADSTEKERFSRYVKKVLSPNIEQINQAWRKHRFSIDFPLVHKLAIQLFIWKYNRKLHGDRL